MSGRPIVFQEVFGGRLILLLALMAAAMAVQAFAGASPALALTERPDDTYMTNGKVYATALSGDEETLYIGGRFTRVNENPPGEPGISRAVSNLAAIDVDTGAVIRDWRPQVTGDGAEVRSLAVKDGLVYIGGNFTALEGQPRKNLAAVDANTASVSQSFAPQVGGATSYVYALETSGSKLYVGGGFSKVGAVTRKNLAAFSLATGALDPDWKPATGKAPTCTDPSCGTKVRSLELDSEGTSIFVGGSFSYITGSNGNGDTRQSVARVRTAGTGEGNLHPWEIPDGTIDGPQTAWDLTATGNRLYGGFGAAQNFLAAFRLDQGDSGTQAWRFGTRGNVQSVALAPDGSRLFFGGHFGLNGLNQTVCNDEPLRGLGSLNPATGQFRCDVPSFVPSLDQSRSPSYEGAWTMTTTDSHLWVGGGFSGVSGVPQTNLARFTL